MITDLTEIRRQGEKLRAENLKLRQHLKRRSFPDRRLRVIAEQVESQIDCTTCANCCREATACVTERDIERLAKLLRVSRAVFVRDYTEETADEGLILKRGAGGCVFLDGNHCTVYEARPQTCEQFPHLVRGPGSIVARMWDMPDRATYCPIAFNTLEAFKEATAFRPAASK